MDFAKVKAACEDRGYKVTCFETKEEAADYVAGALKGEVIGIGGSVTVDQMGLFDRLTEKNTVWWHWRDRESLKRYGTFTVFLSSVNAVAETGELVNIDGTGNRISATLYGPRRVIFLVGKNKIAPDLPAAIERAKASAIPNAARLKRRTPCVQTGKCSDCRSPDRICNAMTIYWMKMMGFEEEEIVFINEDLGF